jgi:hypothetical protein
MEQGVKLSRASLHWIGTPNSNINLEILNTFYQQLTHLCVNVNVNVLVVGKTYLIYDQTTRYGEH